MNPRTKLIMLPATLIILSAVAWAAIGTVNVAGAQKNTLIARAHKGELAPSFDKPIFILVLGGDARAGNPTHPRTDSIHILAINPTTMSASIVGIPRDSYVDIPGHGKAKINEAGHDGGPQLAVQTVERLSGCRFNYYMLTNFQGFAKLVSDFGGITIRVRKPMYEACCSHVNLSAGVHRVKGGQALAFARDRHTVANGDFTRSENQGLLMIGALDTARKDYKGDVATPLRALASLLRSVNLNIPLGEALRLGMFAMRLDPKHVTNVVVKGQIGTAGKASIVKITSQGLHQLFDVCRDAILGNG